MNILFVTLLDFDSIDEKNIYTDLLREFVKNKHKIYIVSPKEKKRAKTRVLHRIRIQDIKIKNRKHSKNKCI